MSQLPIVYDPGHPSRPGDHGVNLGLLHEDVYTLATANLWSQRARALPFYRPFLTRRAWEPVGLRERADFAREHNAAIAISIHVDSGEPDWWGAHVICRPDDRLAIVLGKAFLGAVPPPLQHWLDPHTERAHWPRAFHVLEHHGDWPALVVELGFGATNQRDREALCSEPVQHALCQAHLVMLARLRIETQDQCVPGIGG